MAKRQAAKLSDQLREAIRHSEQTRYAIGKATGVDQAVLSKFLKGERGVSLATVDLLADYLNLELSQRKAKG